MMLYHIIFLVEKKIIIRRHDPFTADGRISTGEILPGESVEITF